MKIDSSFFFGVAITSLMAGFYEHFSDASVGFAVLMAVALILCLLMTVINKN